MFLVVLTSLFSLDIMSPLVPEMVGFWSGSYPRCDDVSQCRCNQIVIIMPPNDVIFNKSRIFNVIPNFPRPQASLSHLPPPALSHALSFTALSPSLSLFLSCNPFSLSSLLSFTLPLYRLFFFSLSTPPRLFTGMNAQV